MNSPPIKLGSSEELKLRVANELESMSLPGELLGADSTFTTENIYRRNGIYSHQRMLWHADIVTQIRAQQSPSFGTLVIVTAGPPGAGKSTYLNEHINDLDCYRRIDSDIYKVSIAGKLQNSQVYKNILNQFLCDDRTIKPLELSTLIHNESVYLANMDLQRSLKSQENLIIEGSLAWAGAPKYYRDLLFSNDYDSLTIIHVDKPLELVIDQALNRWWKERINPENSLGGRFIPSYKIREIFQANNRSVTNQNAQELLSLADEVGMEVELIEA